MSQTPFQIGTRVLGIGFAGAIIYYLKNLETIGCKCAMNYKRSYIMYYTIFNLVLVASNLVSGNRLTDYIAKSSFAIPIILVLASLGITNVVFTLQYIEELKKDNCECSESVFRTMMYILSIISAITWGIALLLLLTLGGLIMSLPEIKVPTLKSSKGKK